MNLRLREGIDLAAYQARWGTRPRPEAQRSQLLIEQGMLRQDGENICRATTAGGRPGAEAVICRALCVS